MDYKTQETITPQPKRCPFKITRGNRKDQQCGDGLSSDKYEYCVEHRRVMKNRVTALKRYADKWGINAAVVV